MKTRNILTLATLACTVLLFSCNNIATNVSLKTQADSASYAIGADVGNNIINSLKTHPGGKEISTDIVLAAFYDVVNDNELKLSDTEARMVIQSYFSNAQVKEAEKSKADEAKFFEENAGKAGIQSTESGLQYEILVAGNGDKPVESDRVKVHYHGTLTDGTVFDSSVDRGEPAEFSLTGVIRGWTEILQLMPVGSKWKVYIPSELGYGTRGSGPKIGPNTPLVFEIELLEILKQ